MPGTELSETADDPGSGAHRHSTDSGLDQPFAAGGLYALRAAVAAHAGALRATGRAVDDIVLVAHELASNAVRHGGGRGRLRLWAQGDLIHCEVSDQGAGIADPDTLGHELPAHTVAGGRGLWIVRQLSVSTTVVSSDAGTRITVALPTSRPPAGS